MSFSDQFFQTVTTQPALVAFVVIAFLVGVGILVVFLRQSRYANALRRGHDFVVLLVRVPKEVGEKDVQPPPIEDQIAIGESFFAIIGGMKAERGVKASVRGRQDYFAFEIVAQHGLISFYCVVPKEMQTFFEEQVHAQHPNAQLEEVEDYNAFTPAGVAVGTEMVFQRPYAFPIRTYRNQETDPLNALTSALSRLGADESGVIQYVARSAHPRWHRAGTVMAPSSATLAPIQ